ncbi:MAG: cadmium resistance transporter [Drouetiella hepatica Uher 2000/2452]|jgi:cadmium resistance transport/sequestration family protein|uniref:Cadmium resistance transporter n=1 Tax=Drouetiella hepatica Uher 2000/2452 TaxID=904376 RepID=A0A951UL30_9CYAN|nr:cadmium resistance transporter [Drouetiella hepatica Uher 2000/2452]
MPILTPLSTAITAFTATNLDDIVILLLFFSQANALFRHRHIVIGQYLGFAVLVLVSLPGFFGGLLLPVSWTGMLGIVPIAIGLNQLLNREEEEESGAELEPISAPFGSFLSPQTYGVAAITFANGGDNVGIYVPLFASCTWESLVVVLGVFFSLVGVWCYTAYRLAKVPAIATALTRYGNQFVPFVLIGLGAMILIESHTLEDRGLLLLTLVACCCTVITLSRNLIQPAK